MENYQPQTYGQRIANAYDRLHPSANESCIDLLAEYSGGGRVLELGIGTGRIALPLKARGVDIHGIDVSPAMVKQLLEKPDGTSIPVVIGDFSDLPVEGSFNLIFAAFSTFFGLTTQELQVKGLENVRSHLAKNGRFLIEAFVPDIGRFTDGQVVRATSVSEDEIHLEVSRHDRSTQQIVGHHLILSGNGIQMYPVKIRYLWPSELDMMARVAGLKLVNRWEDWGRTTFSAKSNNHISIFESL